MKKHMKLSKIIWIDLRLFSGMIEGTGPRYCPSIEDKVVKFADKDRHQVFIEPEGIKYEQKCISEECQVLFLKMSNMQCIEQCPGLRKC